MSPQKNLQINLRTTHSPQKRWLASHRTRLQPKKSPSWLSLSKLTVARSLSRRKTSYSSSTSYAAKSCLKQVGPPPTLSDPKLTCYRSPKSSRSAVCPSSRLRGAGSSSESAYEMCKNVKVSLWRLQGSDYRLICAATSPSCSNCASLTTINKSMALMVSNQMLLPCRSAIRGSAQSWIALTRSSSTALATCMAWIRSGKCWKKVKKATLSSSRSSEMAACSNSSRRKSSAS